MSTEITITNDYVLRTDADVKQFDLQQRKAMLLSKSTLVPKDYINNVANCAIAFEMAQRLNSNVLMVMQNLYVIHGRPSWSSQWIIAAINSCGKYTSLKFDVVDLGEKEVNKIKIHDFSCVAYATERETGDKLESAKVTVEMAVREGWYAKTGSKWQTMPEIMLRYRAASFFGKIYAPELLMGLQSVEENQDIQNLSPKYPNAVEMPPENKPAKFVPTPIVEEVKQEPTTEPTLDISNAVQDAQDYELEDIMAEVSGDKKESW
jgi:hypothetical protein